MCQRLGTLSPACSLAGWVLVPLYGLLVTASCLDPAALHEMIRTNKRLGSSDHNPGHHGLVHLILLAGLYTYVSVTGVWVSCAT